MGISEWSRKGATLSNKSARKEFGLTQKEIIEAINDGIQYSAVSAGNPFLELLRNVRPSLVRRKPR